MSVGYYAEITEVIMGKQPKYQNLPPLFATEICEEREQRIFKMPPSPDRTRLRSKTYTGIARAMAEQWG